MIMVEGSDLNIVNLKFLLCFDDMLGLKINFDKSEIVVLGYLVEEQQRIADSMNHRLPSPLCIWGCRCQTPGSCRQSMI